MLQDAAGRILLAQRHAKAHQGGLWEFPGGKLETQEQPSQGLIRELREELGIIPTAFRPLIQVQHQYPDLSVLLDIYRVTAWQGDPKGCEGQPLAWVMPEHLADYPMPAADQPVLKAMALPDLMLITPFRSANPDELLRRFDQALSQRKALVQFRMDECQPGRQELAKQLLRQCRARGCQMLVNADIDLACEIGAQGLHLNSSQLNSVDLGSLPAGWLLGASCHSSEELSRAGDRSFDYALLSPVLPTPSHPGANTLGWDEFERLVRPARMPVYALGGMSTSMIPTAWAMGAQGVAGISLLDELAS